MNHRLLTLRRASSARFSALPRAILQSVLGCLLSSVLSLSAIAAENGKKTFDLPAGAAGGTLKQFAAQAGREIVFATEAISAVKTKAVQGELTPHAALDLMLADTGLVASQDPKTGAFAVRKRMEVPNAPRAAPVATSDRPDAKRLPGHHETVSMSPFEVGQGAPTGRITGRIFNPATEEYVRNAEITVTGSNLGAYSEADGSYVLTNIPAGEVVLTVTYTGYDTVTARLIVGPGQTATRDFELKGSVYRPGAAAGGTKEGGVVILDKFEVSSVREGNAKAIMEQRQSMNITNTVASDTFGDMAEGNVGDFLRNMPGIDLELTQGEVRNVRLRGLGSEYNAVTVDGVSLASADANKGAAGDARGFSFEQVSLSSMDSIEVSKTISADVDANAPAGTINLKSKHAFSRSDRRIVAQANLTAVADEWHFRKTYGPDDAKHRKINPGGILEFSDVYFNRRLGVMLSVAESNMYSENARSVVSYNSTATAADPRPLVPASVEFQHSPRINRRSTGNLKTDFKASDHLVLSLMLMYNYAVLYNVQRQTTFNAGTRAAIAGDDPLTSFTSAANGTVRVAPVAVVKPGETYTAVPRFEYKRGNLTLDGKFAASDSKSWYNSLARKGSVYNAGGPELAGVQFRAERSSLISSDWKITQIDGPDFSVGNRHTSPVFLANDGRFGRTQVYSGDLAATYKTSRLVPMIWKTGIKRKHEVRDFLLDRESKQYSYTGPGAGTGAWADIPSPFRFDPDSLHARISSLSGGTVFFPNLLAMGKLFQERPDYFTQSLTAANYYNAFVGNTRHYEEDIAAGFFMGTASFGRALVRAGIRYEETKTDALEFNPRTAAEVRAAGYAETNGRATTIPGLQYQFFSQPKIHRKGSYDNWFPSASFKYRFTRSFDLHLGYSSTIRRPTIRDLAGVWVINDDNLTVNVPNPRLKPETSDNFAARLAYYFEPVGLLGFNLFQNTVQGLHRSTRMTAAEYGYAGEEDLSAYEFISVLASQNEVRIRGMELEYNQGLSFLPRPFKGLTVRASYTRIYSGVITPSMSPHGANAGLNYTFNRFNIYSSVNWRDDTPTNVAGTTYYRHRATIDLGGGVRLSSRFTLLYSGRNIRSTPLITMQRIRENPAVAQTIERTGTIWTFGLKGVW